MAEVRMVAVTDRRVVAAALGRAFADDPVFEWLIPKAERRAQRAAHLFAALLRHHQDLGGAWTTDGREGAALWAPPKKWKLTGWSMIRTGPAGIRALRWRAVTGMLGLAATEKVHPHEPHWYLAVLGTDPTHQGKGIGSALMQPVLDRCDEEGVPAYLESSKERNIPFYARHGFEVREPVQLGRGGPPVWPMWREPRPK